MEQLHVLTLTNRRRNRHDLAFSALPAAPVVDRPERTSLAEHVRSLFTRRRATTPARPVGVAR